MAGPRPGRFSSATWFRLWRDALTRPDCPLSAEDRAPRLETLESRLVLTAPSVAQLSLLRDTGPDAADAVTSDPRLVGTVGHDGTTNYLSVQFDHDGDGDGGVDGQTTSLPDDTFSYGPTGLLPGPHTVSARAGTWDADADQYDYGAWSSFSFTLVSNTPAQLADLALLRDTGVSATDGVTRDATLTGRLTDSDGQGGLYTVEIDFDGDDLVDQTLDVAADEPFVLEPEGLAEGVYTLRLRGSEYDSYQGGRVAGPWSEIAFTLEIPRPQFDSLGLDRDTGTDDADRVTYDPTIAGALSFDGLAARGAAVEFDFDHDGAADRAVAVGWDGVFQYTPPDLLVGQHSVAVRGVLTDPETGRLASSDWQTVSFTLVADPGPQVTDLALLFDDDSDGTTEIAAVTGLVTDGGQAAAFAQVEFDHDGDGIADGATTADASGRFTYTARSLEHGSHTFTARGVKLDERTGEHVHGAWSTGVTFDYAAAPRTYGLQAADGGPTTAYLSAGLETAAKFAGAGSDPHSVLFLGVGVYTPLAALPAAGVYSVGMGLSGDALPADYDVADSQAVSRSGQTLGGDWTQTGTVTVSRSFDLTGADRSSSYAYSWDWTYDEDGGAVAYTFDGGGLHSIVITGSGTWDGATLAGTYTVTETENSSFTFGDGGDIDEAAGAGTLASTWSVSQTETVDITHSETGTFTGRNNDGTWTTLANTAAGRQFTESSAFADAAGVTPGFYTSGRRRSSGLMSEGDDDGTYTLTETVGTTTDYSGSGTFTYSDAGRSTAYAGEHLLTLTDTAGGLLNRSGTLDDGTTDGTYTFGHDYTVTVTVTDDADFDADSASGGYTVDADAIDTTVWSALGTITQSDSTADFTDSLSATLTLTLDETGGYTADAVDVLTRDAAFTAFSGLTFTAADSLDGTFDDGVESGTFNASSSVTGSTGLTDSGTFVEDSAGRTVSGQVVEFAGLSGNASSGADVTRTDPDGTSHAAFSGGGTISSRYDATTDYDLVNGTLDALGNSTFTAHVTGNSTTNFDGNSDDGTTTLSWIGGGTTGGSMDLTDTATVTVVADAVSVSGTVTTIGSATADSHLTLDYTVTETDGGSTGRVTASGDATADSSGTVNYSLATDGTVTLSGNVGGGTTLGGSLTITESGDHNHSGVPGTYDFSLTAASTPATTGPSAPTPPAGRCWTGR